MARAETAALFDVCAGFIYAQTLAAFLALEVPAKLAGGPLTLAQFAEATGLPEAGARALADAAAGLRLLEPRGGGWGLSMRGAALSANPGIEAMVRHHTALYDDLRDPVAVLRDGGARLAAYWPYAGQPAAEILPAASGAYTALMAASQPMISAEILAAYDFSRHRCLLDVGGGSGAFLAAVGAATPRLRLMLLDVKPVAEAAAARLRAAGLGDRASAIGGDFTDPFPPGADVISFVRVLHDHDDATVRHLLTAARAALPTGGTVLIAEPMADERAVRSYFSIYLRAMGSGRPRRSRELRGFLRAAGFGAVRAHATPTPLLCRVLSARV